MGRMLAQCVGETAAGFHLLPQGLDELLHRGIGLAAGDDVQRLHQGYARTDHGGELADEQRHILALDRPSVEGGEDRSDLLAHLCRDDPLAPQLCAYRCLAGASQLAADALSPIVQSFPVEVLFV